MKLHQIPGKIADLEIKRDSMKQELDTLNASYDGIKYRKDEGSMAEKKANRTQASLLRTDIKNIGYEIRNLEYQLEEGRKSALAISLWILFGVIFFFGIAIMTIYKYRLGLFGLTDTHDLMAIINGDNPVMDISLYKTLFWMRFTGIYSIVVGLVGSITTSIWRAFTC